MRNAFIFLFLVVGKTFAQSTLLLPNATKIGNVSALGTCNATVKGTQVFNTTDSKMYFCNGVIWVNLTGGGGGSLTLPYSGSGSSANPTSLFTLSNGGSAPTMTLKNTSNGFGLSVETTNARAISVSSDAGAGIYADSNTGYGVYGISTDGIGVYGYSYNNFSGHFNNKAKVGFNLAVGLLSYSETIARLHIKADDSGGWGQHIRMGNGNNKGYGEILHDDDGMKFRNFQVGESFIFRNADNTTIASINALGNVSIAGSISSDGKGSVVNSTAIHQKIVYFSGNFGMGLVAEDYVDSSIDYENFSGVPKVMVGQVENGTGDWHKVLVTPFNVTATACSVRFTNVSNSTITLSGTWHFTIIGPK